MSLKDVSRYMSLILRHKPEAIGISLDEHGWANVEDVHLSKDEETAINVGSRHGNPVIYPVQTKQMHEEGYKFYLSVNGVWLTKEVPVKYLNRG